MEVNESHPKRISIRNIYKQRKLEKESENKKTRRYNDEEFNNRFINIQKKGNIRLNDLSDLLSHNNLNFNFLEYYFDILYKVDKNRFKNEILLYYPFMTPKLCNKYKIKKEITEKERFLDLFKKILTVDKSEIGKLISEEYSFPKELLKMNYDEKERETINRWGLYGTKIIDFNNIYNEEYFYYVISNYILKTFKDNSSNIYERYISTYKSMKNLIEKSDFYSKKDPEFFECVCLFILNSEKNNTINTINNIPLYKVFVSSMNFELINKEEKIILNNEEIIKIFKERCINATIKNDNLFLKGKNIDKVINNYQNYYITKEFIHSIDFSSEDINLMRYLKFDYLKNPKNYFDGLLYKMIEKYVSSNLSKTSLAKCFKIDLQRYEIVEDEICTKNIHKYIRMIPYCSNSDTGRTIKQYAKILIDPSKQKMMQSIKNIKELKDNDKLIELLEKFINIVDRKYIFEHEHNHLCNILLFFYYVDKDYEINTPPKKIKDNKVVISKKINSEKNEDKDIMNESGEIFETVAYGKVQKFFKLKQLLFIANEKNDELDVEQYKKKYIETMSDNNCIEELFKAFRENDLILSDLVNNIYKELEKELSKIENSGKSLNDLANEIIACKNDYFKDNENEIKSLEKLGNMIVTEDIGHYDCHIPDKIKLMKLENKI